MADGAGAVLALVAVGVAPRFCIASRRCSFPDPTAHVARIRVVGTKASQDRAARFAPGGARWGLTRASGRVEARSVLVSSPVGARGVWVRPWWRVGCCLADSRTSLGEVGSVSLRAEVDGGYQKCATSARFAPGGARWGCTWFEVWSRTVVNPPRRPGGRHSPLLGERQEVATCLVVTWGGLCADQLGSERPVRSDPEVGIAGRRFSCEE